MTIYTTPKINLSKEMLILLQTVKTRITIHQILDELSKKFPGELIVLIDKNDKIIDWRA